MEKTKNRIEGWSESERVTDTNGEADFRLRWQCRWLFGGPKIANWEERGGPSPHTHTSVCVSCVCSICCSYFVACFPACSSSCRLLCECDLLQFVDLRAYLCSVCRVSSFPQTLTHNGHIQGYI